MTPHADGEPGTWRLFAPALITWGAAAAAIAHPGAGTALALISGGAGLALLVVVRRPRAATVWRHCAIGLAALVLIGAQIHIGEFRRTAPELVRGAEQQRSVAFDASVVGYVHSQAAQGEPKGWVEARAKTSRGGVTVVMWLDGETFSAAERDWGPATRVRIRGTPVALEPESAAPFGVRVQQTRRLPPEHALARGAVAVGTAAAAMRAGLVSAAQRVSGAELVPGFAVGDSALVDEALEGHLQASSLTHLIAVSGANCALVTGAAIRLSAMLGLGRRVRVLLAGAMLFGFVFAVGPDASVQRAALMAVVMLVSRFGGKRGLALPALGAAMLCLLISNPWQALQPGFVLSVAATAGILLLVPELELGARRLVGGVVPRWVMLPFVVALAAQITCAPFILFLQPGLAAGGVLANVVAAPAAPVGTALGLLALVVLPFSSTAGTAVTQLASLPARWVAATAEVSSRLPAATWPWPDGWFGALLLAGVEAALFGAWLFGARRLRIPGDRSVGRVPWLGLERLPSVTRAGVAILIGLAAGVFAAPTVVAPVALRVATPDDWSVVACDVGQGDALLLRDPGAPGTVMLVDTGDDPQRLEACLSRFGVRRLAIVVLTHDDRDHVGALGAITGRVERALVAPANLRDGDERKVLRELDAAGVPYLVGATGQRGGGAGLTWEVLAPAAGSRPADTNAASLVLRVRAGSMTVLLLADTGDDEQRALRASGAELEATVLKAAHHGSRDQDPALAGAVGAEYALVSVGAENRYGHPTAEALDALEAAGTVPLRTDLLGSIAVSGTPGELRVWSERAPDEDRGERRRARVG